MRRIATTGTVAQRKRPGDTFAKAQHLTDAIYYPACWENPTPLGL